MFGRHDGKPLSDRIHANIVSGWPQSTGAQPRSRAALTQALNARLQKGFLDRSDERPNPVLQIRANRHRSRLQRPPKHLKPRFAPTRSQGSTTRYAKGQPGIRDVKVIVLGRRPAKAPARDASPPGFEPLRKLSQEKRATTPNGHVAAHNST